MGNGECLACGAFAKLVWNSKEHSIQECLRKNERLTSHGRKTPRLTTMRMACNPARPFKKYYRTDKYEPLGAGGFGDVYQTVHLATGTQCAVKVLRKDRFENLDLVKNELTVLLELDHPHVLKLYEYFEDDVAVYVVTELASGGDLLGLLEESRDEDEEYVGKVHDVFRQLMLAVAYCHNLNIAHRDLKMENCLFTDKTRNTLKVIDFGLSAVAAECVSDKEDVVALKMKAVLGTTGYMSPEMIRKATYGVKTDIWSAGVLLYLLLTGVHPFLREKALTDAQLFQRVLDQPFDSKTLDECGVPMDAQDLVSSMLCKDPSGRPGAAEVLSHPWLLRGKTPDKERGKFKDIVRTLPSYCKASKFEQALLTVIAHTSTEQELDELKVAFTLADSNGDGFLTKEELQAAFFKAGEQLSDQELDEIFENFGADDRVYYTEWLALTLKPNHIASDRAIKAAFQFFDDDESGTISTHELLKVLDEDVASSVMHRWDASKDGSLDLQEFAEVVRELAGLRGQVDDDGPAADQQSDSPQQKRVSPNQKRVASKGGPPRLHRSKSKLIECIHLNAKRG